ncbi:MAG: beta-N-acetylhexosaminidase [Proteobacteria bacterium]|nr:beta-N-acetylhexosaminidase [Pseudomonadota bacterium]
MSEISLKHAIGQILIVGFEGTQLTPPLRGALTKGSVGGVVLFSRNMTSQAQLRELTQSIHELSAVCAPWVAVDQEGGKVQRLGPKLGFDPVPPAMHISEMTPAEGYAIAAKTAAQLRDFGFNLNFAPVLDIHTNPKNPIIADRAFGTTPERVIAHALPVIQAHLEAGVVPCGKHFPGHGDTDTDSHTDSPIVMHDLARLRQIEFRPFKAAIDAGIPMIMSAHIRLPQIGERFPATLSPGFMRDILRGELGFDGIIVSDDLEMSAIADNFSCLKAVILGLRAGVDAFLICKSQYLWLPLAQQILDEARQDPGLAERILESAQRILQAKDRFLKPGGTLP